MRANPVLKEYLKKAWKPNIPTGEDKLRLLKRLEDMSDPVSFFENIHNDPDFKTLLSVDDKRENIDREIAKFRILQMKRLLEELHF